MNSRAKLYFALLLVGFLVSIASAESLRLGTLFSDNMVLQRDKPIVVWGWTEAGSTVSVDFEEQSVSTQSDEKGKWVVSLSPIQAREQGQVLEIRSGVETVVLKNVVVGDVWLCSGQSNMNWNVARSLNAEEEIASAHDPLLRHFWIERTVAEEPQESAVTTGWQNASPEVVGDFTAVGYFFARNLRRELGVPIGLVNASRPGAQIEAWMSDEALRSDPDFEPVFERWSEIVELYPKKQREYLAYQEAETLAESKGEESLAKFHKETKMLRPPFGPGHYNSPSGLYNAMIEPLRPFVFRGTIWYQGEGNAGRHQEYAKLFSTLVESWRREFKQPEMPFYWVQLASRGDRPKWPWLREAQTEVLRLPNTGQALAIDIGDPDSSHPLNKQEVGRRLSLIALAKEFGRGILYEGPMLESVSKTTGGLLLRFAHAEGGLTTRAGEGVAALEVAGEDGIYHPAEGKLEGGTLTVFSSEVPVPVYVRYAWSDYPDANLYNAAGLPAVPFRTDRF